MDMNKKKGQNTRRVDQKKMLKHRVGGQEMFYIHVMEWTIKDKKYCIF